MISVEQQRRKGPIRTFAKIDQLNLTRLVIEVQAKLGWLYKVLGHARFERPAIVTLNLPDCRGA